VPTPLPAEADMSAADRRQIQEALRRLDYLPRPSGWHIRATDARGDPPLSADDRRRDDREPIIVGQNETLSF
jgi:hypothetical protein